MERRAVPRLYSTLTGLILVVLALVGFLKSAEFRSAELTAVLPGGYAVNGWANSLHLLIGLCGLALARPAPRLFALVGGLILLGLGIWGVLAPGGTLLFDVLPAARPVNLVNLLLGAGGLLAWIASSWDQVLTLIGGLQTRISDRREKRRRRRMRNRARRRQKRSKSSRRPDVRKPRRRNDNP